MVYFFQLLSGGPIKIGFTSSKSPKNRLANLQTAHAEQLICLATTMSHEEKALHERFAHLRLEGEWFTPSVSLLAWIQANALVTEDGHKQLARPSLWGEG